MNKNHFKIRNGTQFLFHKEVPFTKSIKLKKVILPATKMVDNKDFDQ